MQEKINKTGYLYKFTEAQRSLCSARAKVYITEQRTANVQPKLWKLV